MAHPVKMARTASTAHPVNLDSLVPEPPVEMVSPEPLASLAHPVKLV